MKAFCKLIALVFTLSFHASIWAAADIESNTPGVAALTQSMQTRYSQLAPHYASGAVGLTSDGLISLRDASAVPLPARLAVNALVTAENQDRKALYNEIARANGHPEWADDIRSTFAERWIQRAQPGWWIQSAKGWIKK